jgi:hypothetical protein
MYKPLLACKLLSSRAPQICCAMPSDRYGGHNAEIVIPMNGPEFLLAKGYA